MQSVREPVRTDSAVLGGRDHGEQHRDQRSIPRLVIRKQRSHGVLQEVHRHVIVRVRGVQRLLALGCADDEHVARRWCGEHDVRPRSDGRDEDNDDCDGSHQSPAHAPPLRRCPTLWCRTGIHKIPPQPAPLEFEGFCHHILYRLLSVFYGPDPFVRQMSKVDWWPFVPRSRSRAV